MHEREKINGSGLKRILRASRCSLSGIAAAFRNEAAFRQETILCLVLLPVALWVGHGGVERALLISTLLLVLITELMNTAIEVVVDRISADRNPLSGMAKDLGSAAVTMSIVLALVVWGLVLLG